MLQLLMMNFIDLLIIYLACGAPFGVYYLFQNHAQANTRFLRIKTFLNFIFWIPFAFSLLYGNKNLRKFLHKLAETNSSEVKADETLQCYQKQIEKTFSESDLKISIYEFREIIERYVGLTLVNSADAAEIGEREKEIFRVSDIKNVELGAVCFMRRNRKRLSFHQTRARKDFLHLIESILDARSNRVRLELSAIEMVNSLKDYEARKILEIMFANSLQSDTRQTVKKREKDLWRTETHRPLPIRPVTVSIPAMTATANLRKKD